MKSKQFLTAILFFGISIFLIAGCSSTKKPEGSVNIQLLNFDQLKSAELKSKGFVSNNLYIGIEFYGYGDCTTNAPAYFATADSRGDTFGENTLFINKINPEYVEFMNSQRNDSDEPHNCYYETTIPSAFSYLNGSCSGKDFTLAIKVKYDSIGEYLEPQKEFDCEAVLNALKGHNTQAQSNEPIPQSAEPIPQEIEPCYWERGIVGSWANREFINVMPNRYTVLVFKADGEYMQYKITDGAKSNQNSLSWECQQDGKLSISTSKYMNAVEIVDENTIMITNSLDEKVYYIRVEDK